MTAEPPSRSDGPDPGLDVDAAFAEIVAHWGPTDPEVGGDAGQPRAEPPAATPGLGAPATAPGGSAGPSGPSGPSVPSVPAGPPDPVDRGGSTWDDSLHTRATWEDEGHFVPPAPPPLPVVEPRRRMAWTALAGAPVVGMLLLLLGVAVPSWASSFLVCAFVGGFCYLVATMGQHSSRDDWSGDDGAVL